MRQAPVKKYRLAREPDCLYFRVSIAAILYQVIPAKDRPHTHEGTNAKNVSAEMQPGYSTAVISRTGPNKPDLIKGVSLSIDRLVLVYRWFSGSN